ncbi:MAG: nucleotidyltransferase domain-containing protein [Acidimicrobiia bacterium]
MDFASPIESLVTGSRGKVLAALARSGAETTLRGLSRQADVSPNHVGTIIGDLVELGLVERREAPPASLVRLSPTNIASTLLRRIADLTGIVTGQMAATAASIQPAPVSLIVFGSFVHGRAGRDSDIDVAAVCSPEAVDDDTFLEALWSWAAEVTALTGNTVNLVIEDAPTATGRLKAESGVWGAIRREGISLVGMAPEDLARS